MRKIGILFLLLICLINDIKSQSVTAIWADTIGSSAEDRSYGIAKDDLGNIYISGWFGGTVDFDPGPGIFNLASAGMRDVFVMKLDNSGSFMWAKGMGGTGDDYCFSVTVDHSGNVYTTGSFVGNADFDPGIGVFHIYSGATYRPGIFISKLSSSGSFIWAKAIAGGGSGRGNSIETDPSGNIYITGTFGGTLDFDPGPGVYNFTGGGSEMFVSKFDPAGNFKWVKSFSGNAGGFSLAMAVDAAGNVFTTGYFCGTHDFDPGSGTYNLTSTGYSAIFISKLDASGNFIFAKAMTTYSMMASGFSIAVDPTGNIYTTGYIDDTTDFDPGPGIYKLWGGSSMFISKLDSSGNFVWAKNAGPTGSSNGYSIKVDGANDIYVTGSFLDTVDFDPGPGVFNLASTATYLTYDAFISKFDDSGNFIWAKGLGTAEHNFGESLVIDSDKNIFVTGYSHPVNGWSASNIFISKFCQMETPEITGLTSICEGDSVLLTASPGTNYIWNTGEQTQSIFATVSGNYSVSITNENGCSSTSGVFTVLLDPCTEVSEVTADHDFEFYPNPFKQKGYMVADVKGSFQLYDLIGEELGSGVLEKGTNEIDLSLPAGIYLLKFKEDILPGKILTKRLIIE
jgi:hypothetical protein